ncbi:MAG: hypothetical protein JXR88_07865 [Clostridia bacterium]|nr:hypothetical protein [Clostridia bacterium]
MKEAKKIESLSDSKGKSRKGKYIIVVSILAICLGIILTLHFTNAYPMEVYLSKIMPVNMSAYATLTSEGRTLSGELNGEAIRLHIEDPEAMHINGETYILSKRTIVYQGESFSSLSLGKKEHDGWYSLVTGDVDEFLSQEDSEMLSQYLERKKLIMPLRLKQKEIKTSEANGLEANCTFKGFENITIGNKTYHHVAVFDWIYKSEGELVNKEHVLIEKNNGMIQVINYNYMDEKWVEEFKLELDEVR